MEDHFLMVAPVLHEPPIRQYWPDMCVNAADSCSFHCMPCTAIQVTSSFFLPLPVLFDPALPPLPPFSCHCSRCERLLCNESEECLAMPLRITYYYLTFPTNIPVSTDIFRMGPSHNVAGDDIQVAITAGNEGGFFKTARLLTGGVMSVAKVIDKPQDFDLSLELRLRRYGTLSTYLAKVLVFVTPTEPKLAYKPHSE